MTAIDMFGAPVAEPKVKRQRVITWQCPRCAREQTNYCRRNEYIVGETIVVICSKCYRWLVRKGKDYKDSGWKITN